jgi:predicted ATP-grasp superfamily ATP-dependent carboligase
MMRRVLLFEYLHVHSQWYADASPSMRDEGRAMLLAMAADIAALNDVAVTVALCEAVHGELTSMPGVDIICVKGVDEVSFVTSVLRHGPFSDVLPIAPETGGVLATLVREFRSHGQHVIAAAEDTILLGSDKWQMFQFLQQHRVATIPTKLVTEHTDGDFAETYVIKPIDGAGCEGVKRLTHDEFVTYRMQNSCCSDMIVQPFIAGQSYSVGLIGQGADTPPLILPVATQDVEWSVTTPHYRGGSIPASLPKDSHVHLQDLLSQLLKFVTVDSGYVGIDLLRPVNLKDGEWLITEINPRLCTSYIGYRQATTFNLARYLLGNRRLEPIEWKAAPLDFSCESTNYSGYN